MATMMLQAAVVLALLIAFFLYPRLMFGLLGSLARGVISLVADGIALLVAWI